MTLWGHWVILGTQNTVMPVTITQPEEQIKVQTSVPADVWRRARSKAALLGQTNSQMLVDALELYVSADEGIRA